MDTPETPEQAERRLKREAAYRELKAVPASELAKVRAMIFTPEGGTSRLRMAGDPPGPSPGVAVRDADREE